MKPVQLYHFKRLIRNYDNLFTYSLFVPQEGLFYMRKIDFVQNTGETKEMLEKTIAEHFSEYDKRNNPIVIVRNSSIPDKLEANLIINISYENDDKTDICYELTNFLSSGNVRISGAIATARIDI